jgi:hypothetical protein
MNELLQHLREYRWPPCIDEYILQGAVQHLLRDLELEHSREAVLSPSDRPDFLLANGTVIECKVAGTVSGVRRQLGRYMSHEQVTDVILITRRAVHLAVPRVVLPKPCQVVFTGAVL